MKLRYIGWLMVALFVGGCHSRDRMESVDVDEAVDLVLRLPEIVKWSRWIRRTTNNRVNGVCMLGSEVPDERDGKLYWRVGFYENQPTHMHRWETFLVDIRTGEIFIENTVDLSLKTLAQWRKEDKPMERIKNADSDESALVTFITRNYRVIVEHDCEEGCVSCNNIKFVCVDKRTGKTIRAIGSTMHSTGSDGVTPSAFWGYKFEYGDCSYQLVHDTFVITRNNTDVLVDEKGKWRY